MYISFGLSINFSASNPTLCLGATEVFDLFVILSAVLFLIKSLVTHNVF